MLMRELGRLVQKAWPCRPPRRSLQAASRHSRPRMWTRPFSRSSSKPLAAYLHRGQARVFPSRPTGLGRAQAVIWAARRAHLRGSSWTSFPRTGNPCRYGLVKYGGGQSGPRAAAWPGRRSRIGVAGAEAGAFWPDARSYLGHYKSPRKRPNKRGNAFRALRGRERDHRPKREG